MSGYAEPCDTESWRLLAKAPPLPPPRQQPTRRTWRTWVSNRLLTLALRCWRWGLLLAYEERHGR